ncbi:hypothetical protein BN80_022 [Yersinia phage phiR1-RT]|uniref:Uncharacterized protein n=1 Tax=Yersinia phage phiR1-RT TaxID=1206558 RepID=I7K2U4_BPPR1|nr:hypothetical protein BN80_022 [Yersinia phage phiR1-RT]CCI88596.1 hypothetical protein BN80_022 [Yersinia phage phiR1-RT]
MLKIDKHNAHQIIDTVAENKFNYFEEHQEFEERSSATDVVIDMLEDSLLLAKKLGIENPSIFLDADQIDLINRALR